MPTTTAGLAWGLAIGGGAAAMAYLVINQKILQIPLRRLLVDVLMPGMLAYPLAGFLRLIWEVSIPTTSGRWETLIYLAVFGLFYTLAYLSFSWVCLLTEQERRRLNELCMNFLWKAPQWKNS